MAVLPTRTVEVEFDAGVWTDLAADVVEISTRRGRNRESGAFETGRLSFTVRNDTRKYDPDHTAGTYYGKLRPNRRVRFKATYNAVTYPVFQGYIDRITQNYGGPNDATATFDASDLFKILARVELPESVYVIEVPLDSPDLWWRLDESAGSTVAFDSSGNGYNGTTQGAVVFGAPGLVGYDPDTAASFAATTPDTIVYGDGPTISNTTVWAIEFWIKFATLSGSNTILNVTTPSGAGILDNRVSITISGAGEINFTPTPTGFGGSGALTIGGPFTTGVTYHCVATYNSDQKARFYVDGVLVAIAASATTGAFSPSRYHVGDFDGTIDEFAVYVGGATTALSTTRIAAHNTVGRTPWNGDLPGARLTRVLDLAGVPAGDRTIGTGAVTLQSTDLGGAALAYAQKIEETEAGRLFVAADGKITFLGRDDAVVGAYLTSQATVVDADSGAGRGYRSTSADVDEGTLVTRATVSRAGSIGLTYKDATAVTEFGLLDEDHAGLLHASDAYSLSYAQWIVNTHKTPLTRTGAVDLALPSDPANMYPDILGVELAERVTYKRKPQNAGSTVTQVMRVEAIEHSTGKHYWNTRLQLSPFNLGEGGYGTGVWDSSLWDQATWGL